MTEENSLLLEAYRRYLRLELNLTGNSVEAYLTDATKLIDYTEDENLTWQQLDYPVLQQFVARLYDVGISARSVARIISGVRRISFGRNLV